MSQYAERSYPTHGGVANTLTVRTERPTWRTGALILLAGVFVGGTFGVGVQARRNAMDAQAEMAPAAVAPATPIAPPVQAAPIQAIAPGPTALQPALPQAPPQAYAQAPAAAALPPGAIVIPPQVGVTVVPATPAAAAPAPAQAHAPVAAAAPAPAPQPKKQLAWHAPSRPAAPHGGIIAAKVTPPKPEKAAPPPQAEKPKKGASDAEKILKDAIGETTNTL
jgi:hypothetical protein